MVKAKEVSDKYICFISKLEENCSEKLFYLKVLPCLIEEVISFKMQVF